MAELPFPPFTLMVPAIVTSPLARMVIGVFFEFFKKVTVTLDGTVTVVKLNSPPSGT
jgi:hypothetical protein